MNTLAHNIAFASAGRIIAGFFGVIGTAIVARALGTEGFGLYTTATAFLYLFSAIADFGLYSYLLRELSQPGARERELASAVLTLRMGILVFALGAGIALAKILPYPPAVQQGLFIVAISYFFLSSSQVLMAGFQRYLAVGRATLAELGSRFLQVAALVFLFAAGATNLFLFWFVLAVSAATNFMLMVLLLIPYVRVGLRMPQRAWLVIVRRAFPIGIALMFTLIYFRLDTVILSLMKSPHDVALYNLSYKVLENLIFFPAMFAGIVMPILVSRYASAPREAAEIFNRALRVIAIGAFPMLAGGLLVAPELVRVLGGDAFREAATPFRLLLGATFFIFFGTLCGNAAIAFGKQKQALPIYFVAMLFNVAANVLLIPRFSYVAAAAVTLATEIWVTLGLAWLISSRVSFPAISFWLKVSAAGGGMAGALIALDLIAGRALGVWFLAAAVVLGAPLYGAFVLLFRAIARKDIEFLFGPRRVGAYEAFEPPSVA